MMRTSLKDRKLLLIHFFFGHLVSVLLDILVREELRTCQAAHHQGANNRFWHSQTLSHTPASARQARGTCLRSTSSWGSLCCSRRTGYIRTSRPAGEEPDDVRFHIPHQNTERFWTQIQRGVYQFLPVLHRLQVLLLPFLWLVLLLQVGLDRLVLGIEVTHVLQRQRIESAGKCQNRTL